MGSATGMSWCPCGLGCGEGVRGQVLRPSTTPTPVPSRQYLLQTKCLGFGACGVPLSPLDELHTRIHTLSQWCKLSIALAHSCAPWTSDAARNRVTRDVLSGSLLGDLLNHNFAFLRASCNADLTEQTWLGGDLPAKNSDCGFQTIHLWKRHARLQFLIVLSERIVTQCSQHGMFQCLFAGSWRQREFFVSVWMIRVRVNNSVLRWWQHYQFLR